MDPPQIAASAVPSSGTLSLLQSYETKRYFSINRWFKRHRPDREVQISVGCCFSISGLPGSGSHKYQRQAPHKTTAKGVIVPELQPWGVSDLIDEIAFSNQRAIYTRTTFISEVPHHIEHALQMD